MIANYQYLPDDELDQIKVFPIKEDDLLDFAEDSADSHDILLDIDKMWNALIFDLDLVVRIFGRHPLRKSCFRGDSSEDVSEYISYTENRGWLSVKL